MPIIFPSHCKGVTLGALRQVRSEGITTACKGLASQAGIDKLMFNTQENYFLKTEPIGGFMATMETMKETVEQNSAATREAIKSLVEDAREGTKALNDVTGKMRDGVERMGVALQKLGKVVGNSDLRQTVELTSSLVDALERLSILEEKGLLSKVIASMSSFKEPK